MSPAPVLHCSGAPRDLGLDQGRAARSDVRRAVEQVRPGGVLRRLLFNWAEGPEEARVRRDLMRHFPHMGERALGLARGARVDAASLAALLAPSLDAGDGLAVAAGGGRTGVGPLLLRTLFRETPLWVRHSAPDLDHRSVEVVIPWRVPAVIGVNEHGLAATATMQPATPMSIDRCAAPALLLVQDCLQRFDRLQTAAEWCRRRPAGGIASILLADMTGRVASVRVEGRERGLGGPKDGLCIGGEGQAGVEALGKACAARAPLDAEALAAAGLDGGHGMGVAVVADPLRRAIALVRHGMDPEWHALDEAPPAAPGLDSPETPTSAEAS